MSNTVRSQVQDLELARQAELDWLARLDGCRQEATGYHSEYGLW